MAIILLLNKLKEREIAQFDEQTSKCHQQIPKHPLNCIDHLVCRFNIKQEHSILDIAAGTKLLIAHASTRNELKEHHKSFGYTPSVIIPHSSPFQVGHTCARYP